MDGSWPSPVSLQQTFLRVIQQCSQYMFLYHYLYILFIVQTLKPHININLSLWKHRTHFCWGLLTVRTLLKWRWYVFGSPSKDDKKNITDIGNCMANTWVPIWLQLPVLTTIIRNEWRCWEKLTKLLNSYKFIL